MSQKQFPSWLEGTLPNWLPYNARTYIIGAIYLHETGKPSKKDTQELEFIKSAFVDPQMKPVPYDLIDAAGMVKRNKQGQVFRKTHVISEDALLECQLPDQIILHSGEVIRRPDKYAVPKELR